jgi:hypothetical protein
LQARSFAASLLSAELKALSPAAQVQEKMVIRENSRAKLIMLNSC